MKGAAVFSPRMLAAWLAGTLVLAAMSLYFSFGGGTSYGTDVIGPSTFSRSAIGYAGIAETLRRLGVRTIKSQFDSLGKAGRDGLLVVAEPRPYFQPQQLSSLLNGRHVLLVLPKWTGDESTKHKGWIEKADLIDENTARWVLGRALVEAEIVRVPSVTWSRDEIGAVPKIVAPVQLVRSYRLRPIVVSNDGILLGQLVGKGLWVLSDPDVMENHGLSELVNAQFSVDVINALRANDGNVVFDETTHGYASQPDNPLKLLFEFPFVLATVQAAIAIAILLWATMGRFGVPQRAPIALQAGKYGLIQNTAKLFEFAGYQHVIVRRYVHAIIRDVARQLHAPAGLADGPVTEWLTRIGDARGVAIHCGVVLHRADELANEGRRDLGTLAGLARMIYRWKGDITDGAARHSGHDRRHTPGSAQGGGRAG